MKRVLTGMLAICLMVGLCGCWGIQLEPIQEEQPMDGYIHVDVLQIFAEPTEESDVVGEYVLGDYVMFLEIRDGWGRTDLGWIWLDYVESWYPGDAQEQDGNNNSNNNDNNTGSTTATTQNTDPTETTAGSTQLPASDHNQAILGSWYRANYGGPDEWGYVSFMMIDFDSYGYYSKGWYQVNLENPDFVRPGGGDDLCYYATSGSTLYRLHIYEPDKDGDDIPTVYTSSFSVSGNVLTIDGTTYYRGTAQDVAAKIKEQYAPSQETTQSTESTESTETTTETTEATP